MDQKISANELEALRYLCGGKTTLINSLSAHMFIGRVAHNTPKLLAAGLIDYAPSRWSGYKATAKGKAILNG